MRRSHRAPVLISLFMLTRYGAASSTPSDSLLEPFSLDESLVLGEPVAYGVLLNGGYQSFEPDKGDERQLLVPAHLMARDPKALRFSSHGQLRLTILVDDVLRSADSSVVPGALIVVPESIDLVAGLPADRRLYRIKHSVGGMSVVAMHAPCDTNACTFKLMAFARRAVSFLDLPEVPPRQSAELYFDLAIDEDFGLLGLRLLNRHQCLLPQLTPREVVTLVTLATNSGPLSDRFMATLGLPFDSAPAALWVEACRDVEDALRLDEGLERASAAIELLVHRPRVAFESEQADDASNEARAVAESMLMLFSRRFMLDAEDTTAHAPLLRHIWAGLVKSGLIPEGRYDSYWWRPDLAVAAVKHLERLDRNSKRLQDEGSEYEEPPDEWESCWAVPLKPPEENQHPLDLAEFRPDVMRE